MPKIFNIYTTGKFERDYKKFCNKDFSRRNSVKTFFEILRSNPFSMALRTHKKYSKRKSLIYSSRVTSDLRILWEFENECSILVLELGGHSGKNSVYK